MLMLSTPLTTQVSGFGARDQGSDHLLFLAILQDLNRKREGGKQGNCFSKRKTNLDRT
ncbi:hypothetical protein LINPERHAP1_LOCUS36082 [Linum perenne]